MERSESGRGPRSGLFVVWPVALLLAVLVLPSARNLPNAEPSQTLEYAPVPPQDDEPPPPPDESNLTTLSLGQSDSGPAGGGPGGDGPGRGGGPPPPPPGVGDRPINKRCVGQPLRQTEDLMAPPCVAFFEGDNGGATAPGVTADEVRILFYWDGHGHPDNRCNGTGPCDYGSRGTTENGEYEYRPTDEYIDLAEPPPPEGETITIRLMRAFQNYFNERYQTYGRSVHFFIYYNATGLNTTPESIRADAAANVERIKPFAIMNYALNFGEHYVDAATAKGVMNFGSRLFRSEEQYREQSGLLWGFPAPLEQAVAQYVEAVCKTVVPYPASFSGNPLDNGQPRKLGLIRTSDPKFPEFVRFAKLAKQGIEDCGGVIAAEGINPVARSNQGARGGESNFANSQQYLATFQQEGVTTVLWPTGYDAATALAAASINYRPEWVIAGDTYWEGYEIGTWQEPTVFHDHAWVVSTMPLKPYVFESDCFRALMEGEPEADPVDYQVTGCQSPFYEDLRQLFTGIQVAGPVLTKDSINVGFHAIPEHRSPDPYIPACFYLPGDYTCVKDAFAQYWDRYAQSESAGYPGCWRAADAGRRFQRGAWPDADLLTLKHPDTDPCNEYAGLSYP